MKTKKQLSDLVDLLVDTSYSIVKQKAGIATGPQSLLDKRAGDEQVRLLKLVQPLIATTTQTRKLQAENAAGVLSLLKEGKIEIKEAIQLMSLIRERIEVESAEKNAELLDEIEKAMS